MLVRYLRLCWTSQVLDQRSVAGGWSLADMFLGEETGTCSLGLEVACAELEVSP